MLTIENADFSRYTQLWNSTVNLTDDCTWSIACTCNFSVWHVNDYYINVVEIHDVHNQSDFIRNINPVIVQVKRHLFQHDVNANSNLSFENIAYLVAQMKIQPIIIDHTNVNMTLLGKRTKPDSQEKRADSIRR